MKYNVKNCKAGNSTFLNKNRKMIRVLSKPNSFWWGRNKTEEWSYYKNAMFYSVCGRQIPASM
jgi:hypothetical protein